MTCDSVCGVTRDAVSGLTHGASRNVIRGVTRTGTRDVTSFVASYNLSSCADGNAKGERGSPFKGTRRRRRRRNINILDADK